jgi:hypothetical protein
MKDSVFLDKIVTGKAKRYLLFELRKRNKAAFEL